MSSPLRVVFMGTPDFAVPSLKALAARPDLTNIVAVYTQPDRPAGRGHKLTKPPIKVIAEELKLPIFQPENVNAPDEKKKLSNHLADLVVVVAYAQFLGKGILNLPRLGCFNVHSSLLPKYRGAAPIQYAIWKGEKESGVTTMRLISKMDAGPILLQKKIAITDEMRAGQLHDALANIGAELIVETLALLRDRKLEEKEQDETQATYAPIISKEQGLIDWGQTGHEILCQIRALDPWPGTFGRSTRGVLKVHKARFHAVLQGLPASAAPGTVSLDTGSLLVKCKDGWMELLTVQPEGKKQMTAQEFLNGVRNLGEFSIK